MALKFKRDKRGFPDPLHIELPHTHKKMFELIYMVAIIGAMVSIVMLNIVAVLSVSETNVSSMLLFVLGFLLAMMLVEKSLVHHRPLKSSS